ncbi:MAG: hypothetical protein ACR2PT_14255 [Endozoicomonas sp.]
MHRILYVISLIKEREDFLSRTAIDDRMPDLQGLSQPKSMDFSALSLSFPVNHPSDLIFHSGLIRYTLYLPIKSRNVRSSLRIDAAYNPKLTGFEVFIAGYLFTVCTGLGLISIIVAWYAWFGGT